MLKRISGLYTKKPAFSFHPDFIAGTVEEIDFIKLSEYGIKACFVDLDGTVVHRGNFEVSPKVISVLRSVKLKVYIATNRPKGRDLKNLKEDLAAQGVAHPHGIFAKPTKRYFVNALQDKNLNPHEAVMIGDRFIQDILGANRAGMYSLLVYKLDKPIGLPDRILSTIERRLTLWISKKYFK
ncbi:HAD-IA family hydrolase [Candidatus Saccharibacteria bacterium]|nr:HAD-IA family hydrolase [Candidatus Saccharibacteria bacterium]